MASFMTQPQLVMLHGLRGTWLGSTASSKHHHNRACRGRAVAPRRSAALAYRVGAAPRCKLKNELVNAIVRQCYNRIEYLLMDSAWCSFPHLLVREDEHHDNHRGNSSSPLLGDDRMCLRARPHRC